MTAVTARPRTVALAGRALLLLALWLVLADGQLQSLWVGLPAAAIALLLSLRLSPPGHLRYAAVLQFLPLFLIRSLVAALQVAARALAPSVQLRPALREYRTELPPGLPRVFFANAVSLLPGTLSADIDGPELRVHVLDDEAANEPALRELEAAVARMFQGR